VGNETLLNQPPEPFLRRRNFAFATSLLVHVVFLLWLVHQPRPIFVKPSLLAHGKWESTSIVYLAQKQSAETVEGSRQVQPRSASAMVYARRSKLEHQKQNKPPQPELQVAESPNHPSDAGSPHGSELQGLASGHEVRPALPVIFPDPPIARSELPVEARGDVIVEITIDILGNVVGTKLLQGIGYRVDDVVLATVQKWRFRPATEDGAAIPSQQDVHFHFPS